MKWEPNTVRVLRHDRGVIASLIMSKAYEHGNVAVVRLVTRRSVHVG